MKDTTRRHVLETAVQGALVTQVWPISGRTQTDTADDQAAPAEPPGRTRRDHGDRTHRTNDTTRPDFEDASVHVSFDDDEYVDAFTTTSITDWNTIQSPSESDDSYLRIDIPEGEHYGTILRYEYEEAEGDEPSEAFARYWVRLPESFDPSDGGKLPGFAGTYDTAGWGGRPADGANGWSARVGIASPAAAEIDEDVGVSFYTYHADQGNRYGDNFYWDRGLVYDEWHLVEQHVRLNTPGENDGVLRAWLDENHVCERTDVRFRDTPGIAIEEFHFLVYFGGASPAPTDTAVYVDDLRLGRP